ncbi:MAG: DUF3575 domain-containing protein [Bacteroidaceae bacterium]|nr:DUF3575 domain-containing protein [Bacteroidales bacterium]MBP5769932.1 DUF3575 domain-containing protein [Bacteroidaceae bacterium]
MLRNDINITTLLLSIILWLMPMVAFSSAFSSDDTRVPAITNFPDTTKYAPYSYIRFINEDEKTPELTDEQFYDIAGRVIFPINKYDLPKRDSLILQLQQEVLPLINQDSLELASMIIRGAASPEGPTRWNKFLGEHRAATLLQFLRENIDRPIDEETFDMEIDIEDYRTLCIMMHRASDKDYHVVQTLCDRYLPKKNITALKRQLQTTRQGTLWRRLFRQYFPRLRAARVVLFFRKSRTFEQQIVTTLPEEPKEEQQLVAVHGTTTTGANTSAVGTGERPVDTVAVTPVSVPIRKPRREVLSIKSNLLFDFAYVPGYDRWCPIPNVAIEYYPLHGHFTYGFSFDCPWWQHYDDHKFFQIRNYQLEARYYFRSGDIAKNPPGEGAAFRGLYVQAYGHLGLFGICFDANRGWVGEGAGGGLGIGYVLPLSKKGHWRLEFGLQAGFFGCKYDPYLYESPIEGDPHDNLYYYKYYGDPNLFKERQYRFTWLGPTRVGLTLSYDLFYRRIAKKGISFIPWENVIE